MNNYPSPSIKLEASVHASETNKGCFFLVVALCKRKWLNVLLLDLDILGVTCIF
jgi:hypothetical protein